MCVNKLHIVCELKIGGSNKHGELFVRGFVKGFVIPFHYLDDELKALKKNSQKMLIDLLEWPLCFYAGRWIKLVDFIVLFLFFLGN